MDKSVGSDGASPRVLVVTGFGTWREESKHTGKIFTHIRPIAAASERVTLLSLGPTPDDPNGFDVRCVKPTGFRSIDFLRLALAGARMSRDGSYDLICSYSLVPYGLFALMAKYSSGTPAHLGIIGMDLDVHAEGPFGPLVRWAFRQFDAVSVGGTVYRDRLVRMGVDRDRIHSILHPVRGEFATNEPSTDPTYDLVWVGRMSPEKCPELFLDIVAEIGDRGDQVSAAMVGDGPAFDAVVEAAVERKIDEQIEFVGWQANPERFYREARAYVLTSEREMLPLTIIESMLTGTPVIAPRIGAISDIIEHGANGYLVSDRSPEAYADIIVEVLADPQSLRSVGEHATEIEDSVSIEGVAEAWRDLFENVCYR